MYREKIEQTREERRQIREKIRSIRDEIEFHEKSLERSRQETIQEKEEIKTLQDSLYVSQMKTLEKKQEMDRAVQEKEQVYALLCSSREGLEHSREEFLRKSQEFQEEVLELKAKAQSLGLEDIHMHGFLLANDVKGVQEYRDELPDLPGDPTEWETQDPDTCAMIGVYVEAKLANDLVQEKTKELRERLANLQGAQSAALNSKAKLQSQLQRIQHDNSVLEEEIRQLKEKSENQPTLGKIYLIT